MHVGMSVICILHVGYRYVCQYVMYMYVITQLYVSPHYME